MSEHTKGKWVIDKDSHTKYPINVGKKHIAMVNFYNAVEPEFRVGPKESLANACLIAAAPETAEQRDKLLEVCKKVEWNGPPDWAFARCPSCMNSKKNGHRHNCKLQTAIAEAKKS